MKKDHLKQAIVILGMHRSGTSALTRVLNLCGADLPKTLMQPKSENNEAGFWESSKVMQINNELLNCLGSSWKDSSILPAGWSDFEVVKPYQEGLKLVIENEFPDSKLFVLKDPRICRLLPIWLGTMTSLGIMPYFVFSVRHPLEVAASLGRRDGLLKEHALLLWLQHFLVAEKATRHLKRTFVSYDDLIKDWRGVVQKISAQLSVDLPNVDLNPSHIDEFLRPSLKHHIMVDDLGSHPNISTWVVDVFNWSLDASNGLSPDPKALDAIYAAYIESEKFFSVLLKNLTEEKSNLSAEFRRYKMSSQSQLQSTQTQLISMQTQLQETKAELKKSRHTIAHMKSSKFWQLRRAFIRMTLREDPFERSSSSPVNLPNDFADDSADDGIKNKV
ncbi:MAG: hypothetical protein AAFW84_27395 [Cyanobacteria bacterium J06635_15]